MNDNFNELKESIEEVKELIDESETFKRRFSSLIISCCNKNAKDQDIFDVIDMAKAEEIN